MVRIILFELSRMVQALRNTSTDLPASSDVNVAGSAKTLSGSWRVHEWLSSYTVIEHIFSDWIGFSYGF